MSDHSFVCVCVIRSFTLVCIYYKCTSSVQTVLQQVGDGVTHYRRLCRRRMDTWIPYFRQWGQKIQKHKDRRWQRTNHTYITSLWVGSQGMFKPARLTRGWTLGSAEKNKIITCSEEVGEGNNWGGKCKRGYQTGVVGAGSIRKEASDLQIKARRGETTATMKRDDSAMSALARFRDRHLHRLLHRPDAYLQTRP